MKNKYFRIIGILFIFFFGFFIGYIYYQYQIIKYYSNINIESKYKDNLKKLGKPDYEFYSTNRSTTYFVLTYRPLIGLNKFVYSYDVKDSLLVDIWKEY